MLLSSNAAKIAESKQQDIRMICEELFARTSIVYFHWGNVYNNGTGCCLNTNFQWHKYFFLQDFHLHSKHFTQEGYSLIKTRADYSQEADDAKNLFNIDNKFEITRKIKNGYEVFGFAGSAGDDAVNEFYLNSQTFLSQFTYYFKDKARELIKLARHKENLIQISPGNLPSEEEPLQEKSEFLVRRYYLDSKLSNYITKREFDVLILSLRGYSSKEAARQLKLSPRTVESYMLSCKSKLHCMTKKELFAKVKKAGLIELL